MILIKRFRLIILLLVFGCGKEQILEVPLKGTFNGRVTAGYDYTLAGALPGAKITIQGTDPEITTTTDSDGRFTVNDLGTGTYNIIFEKEGYGTHKILGYTFVAGASPPTLFVSLFALPKLEITDVDLSIRKDFNTTRIMGSLAVDLTGVAANQYGSFLYYLSRTPDVSPTNYLTSGVLGSFNSSLRLYNVSLVLNTNHFPPGTRLYLVIHPCTEPGASYLDLQTGQHIYSSVSPKGSPVLPFDVPM